MAVKNIFGRFKFSSRILGYIELVSGLYASILGIYPRSFNLLLVMGLLLLVSGVLGIFRGEFRSVVKPLVLGVSIGLLLIYLFMIGDVMFSSYFTKSVSIIIILSIGSILSFLTLLLGLFE